MRTRLKKLRWRRQLREGQRQFGGLGSQAEQQIDRHLFRRFSNLRPVRRFVVGWLSLVVLLIGALVVQNLALGRYYQTVKAVPGGIYNEGVKGRFTNANPIYAASDADATVSRLVFSGLLSYDQNGKLTGDLASDYSVEERGLVYRVHLKPHLTWHDGQPLTSRDVVFTYQSIQNPDAQSPLQSSWQGIEVSAPDDQTVVFRLPGVLAAFPYNLTTGIVPRHLLAQIPPSGLRSADFNTVNPVGAGPFVWQAVEVSGEQNPKQAVQQIGLTPFDHYANGQPKLQRFVVRVYADKAQLIQAFADKQLTAVEGLSEVPQELENKAGLLQHNLPLRAANMVFFKTSSGLLNSQPLRHALVQATNTADIIKHLDYPTRAVQEPILQGQAGYDPALAQPKFDLKAAKAILEADGWQVGKDNTRFKDKQKLSFSLTAADTSENRLVSGLLKKQWSALGVKLNVQLLNTTDFQNTLTYHNYEALLNGISIGPDPDVFVYWDSSQADIRSNNRLNLSEYKNPEADASLEAGRTRLDPGIRAVKYKPFLQAWQKDNPAIGLYQPRLLYLTNGAVAGLNDHPVTNPVDRLANVHNWQIREARVSD